MDKTVKLSIFSLIFNIIFATYHIGAGIITNSHWLFMIGIYYAILSVVRFAVLQKRIRPTL